MKKNRVKASVAIIKSDKLNDYGRMRLLLFFKKKLFAENQN